MKLKHGKKYETADGAVFRVIYNDNIFKCECGGSSWHEDGSSTVLSVCQDDLIRRHYTKPQPAHKLDLKPDDFVVLVAWENGSTAMVGDHIVYDGLPKYPKGHRPLWRVVSRANYPMPPS